MPQSCIQLEIDVVITKHASIRMRESGCAHGFIRACLRRMRKFSLLKHRNNDYMINVPFKGWLVGLVEQNKFIAKTFIPILKDTFTFTGITVVIRRVIFPNQFKRAENGLFNHNFMFKN